MYRIDIFDKNFNGLTTIWQQSLINFSYSKELNKPGSANFTLQLRDTRATTTNLRLYNRVKISRDGVGVFIGYIELLRATLNEISVFCNGMLGLFEKRLVSASVNSTDADDAIANILNLINGVDDTGITFGTSNVTNTINDVEFVRSTGLSAFQKLATMAGEAEFEIDYDQNFNFVSQLGVDRSGSVKFQYDINAINTSTIFDFEVEVEGKDIKNAVTGIRNGGGTNTQTDATSIAAYGRLEGAENFSQTNNSTDLANETSNFLQNRKDEFYSPKITINTLKISPDDFDVGDIIKVVLNNGFISLNRNDRIIKKDVSLTSNNTEEVSVSLIPMGSNLLPSNFQTGILSLAKRVSLLESNI